MATVLALSRSRYERFTGLAAGLLVWLFIAVEAPVSGMSLNPARSLGSALAAREPGALWIYFVAPPLGMLAAAAALSRGRGHGCAKLDHSAPRCAFCGKGEPSREARAPQPGAVPA
jgi:aquaporin Z